MKTTNKKINCTGQGVEENTTHCFILDISDNIRIYETFNYNDNSSGALKVNINLNQWENIKESIFLRINEFMQQNNFKKNRITKGINYINTLLGKEITLLLWGIESTNNTNEIIAALKIGMG